MKDICATCLCANRKLVSLQSLSKLLNSMNWLDIKFNLEDKVCWECESLIWKIYRFRRRALDAQESMALSIVMDVPLQPLTNLTIQHKTQPDVIIEENITEYDETNESDSNLVKETSNVKEKYQMQPLTNLTIQHKTEPGVITEENTTEHDETNESDSNLVKETSNVKEEYEMQPLTNLTIQHKTEPEVITEENITEHDETNESDSNLVKETSNGKANYQMNELKFNITIMRREEMEMARESDRNTERFKNLPFKCESCIVSFYHEKTYEAHKRNKHSRSDRKYVCGICETRFNLPESLADHEDRHYRLYQCKECGGSHHRLATMLLHLKHNHLEKRYPCMKCNEVFTTDRQLKHHEEVVHHQEFPKCDYCGLRCRTKYTLRKHIVLSHTVGNPIVHCKVCDKEVKQSSMKAHVRNHTRTINDEAAYCAECDFQFKTQATYARHIKEHPKHRTNQNFRHTCPHCNKGYNLRTDLDVHVMAIHFKKYPFPCNLCHRKFTRKHQLGYHIMEKHKGITPPRDKICCFCQKGFKGNGKLKRHLMIHTGEKPFECEICSMRFNQKGTLKTHIKGKHKNDMDTI